MVTLSAAHVKDCMSKVQTLRYAEEACYNGTLVIKPFSCGLEIGACNWVINGPQNNLAFMSGSISVSGHAMNFDRQALEGSNQMIYSDLSSLDAADNIEPSLFRYFLTFDFQCGIQRYIRILSPILNSFAF